MLAKPNHTLDKLHKHLLDKGKSTKEHKKLRHLEVY